MTQTKRVLIVEDNDKNRKLFRLLLNSLGCECLVAANGSLGIELARDGRPDLILMDVQMPVLDGLSALALLRKDPRTAQIPVVAVTSYAMEQDRERLLSAGFTDYLAKPVDTNQFKDIVCGILDGKNA
ncbi:MAG: response regulator [Desulfuromonadales bacterium]|jgi:two-component system cell cycle response regulator DivK|nr:response regulator [Desulfuromonadales bacterium]